MMTSKNQPPAPSRRWAAWLGMFLIIPLTGASGGMLFGLYRQLSTGQLSTVAKSYGTTSRSISFAESPVWFLVFFVLHAVLAALIILITVVVAKTSFKGLR